MSLKFKQRDPKPVEDLRKKIQSAEISNLKKELDETFKTIGEEFKKIRENPFFKFFNSLTKEQQQKFLKKIRIYIISYRFSFAEEGLQPLDGLQCLICLIHLLLLVMLQDLFDGSLEAIDLHRPSCPIAPAHLLFDPVILAQGAKGDAHLRLAQI